jgi:hypothetical protein
MGIIKEIIIWTLTLMFGWMLLSFFTGGAVGLGITVLLMEAFPIIVKPLIIIGMFFGLIFLLGRHSK